MNVKSSQTTKTPAAPPPSEEVEAGSNLASIFGDPDLTRAVSEDAVLKFVVKSWRHIVVTLLAALAVFYAVNVFKETRQQDIEASGDAFFRMQKKYAQLKEASAQVVLAQKQASELNDEKTKKEVDEKVKNRDEIRRQLEDSLKALSDTKEPYPRLANLYRGLLAREAGDPKVLLAAVNASAWQNISDLTSPERLLAEIDALAFARTQLSDNASFGEARSLLKKLATNGAFVHTSAALAFAATTQTAEERSESLSLLEQVESSHPEQSELLQDEISRLRN